MKGFVLIVVIAVAAVLAHGRLWNLPDRHDPWAPLAFEEPPNWLTRYKLARLDGQPQACLAFLARTGWQYDAVPDRDTGGGCGLHNAVQVRRTSLQLSQPFTLGCPAAASLALWERHVVQPNARAMLASPVRRLEHFGSYACRKVAGSASMRLSQHATAQAIDVAGFVLSDGRRITLARDWNGGDAAGRFLRGVHRGACGLFDGVLGPDYNTAHADHFHLDRGPFRICR